MVQGPKVLLVYPRFVAPSFWNYREPCEMMGKRYPAAPLGLITIGAMLPASWSLRLLDRNTEAMTDADFAGVDLVMMSAMLPQQVDALAVIARCRANGVPIAVGGPDLTSSPHVYSDADFQVRGEAEGILGDFIAAWERGERRGIFEAEKFKADVTSTPIPRFDLLRFESYLHIGVQFSRGCPFTCEFCDIIELYGRVPRTKTTPQMLAELDALYALGYRGHVDFVDDNLIGNKKSLRAFLPFLIEWQKKRGYPFEFSTEASVNLADDSALLTQLREANFFAVFLGIESPDSDTLVLIQKKQNAKRDLPADISKIYDAGLVVFGGFILGFDSERRAVARAMINLIEDSNVPVCMVGLLFALPNTQLTRRLATEGRLHATHDRQADDGHGDQCTAGLNFVTTRDRRAILEDFVTVLDQVYAPAAYFARVRRVGRRLRRPLNEYGTAVTLRQLRYDGGRFVRAAALMMLRHPKLTGQFWRTLVDCAWHNPGALPHVMALAVLYTHLGPFARRAAANVREQIALLDRGVWAAPPLVPVEPVVDAPAHAVGGIPALVGR